MRTYTVRLFTSPIIVLSFFVYCVEGNDVCSRPPLPKNSRSYSKKEFYQVNKTFRYECRRRHYLFGNNIRTCLPNGQWSGNMPYCAGESGNVKLKEAVPEFGILLDGRKTSCLSTLDVSLFMHNSIYLEVGGINLLVAVMIVPNPPFGMVYTVSYYNYSSGEYNYNDLSHHAECLKDSQLKAFRCNFRKPFENPIIRINVGNDLMRCPSCSICEVIVFTYKKEHLQCSPPMIAHAHWNTSIDTVLNSTYSIDTVLIVECEEGYELSGNIKSITCEKIGQQPSLSCTVKTSRRCFSFLIDHGYWNQSYNGSNAIWTQEEDCVVIYEHSSSTAASVVCNEDGRWLPLNCSEIPVPVSTEGSNMVLIYVLPPALFIVISLALVIGIVLKKRRGKKSEPVNKSYRVEEKHQQVNEAMHSNNPANNEGVYYNNDSKLEKTKESMRKEESQYDQINEGRSNISSEITNPSTHCPQPIYINELIQFSNSIRPLSEEEGYPLSEEEGYLVPIMKKEVSLKYKNESGNVYWEDADIYYTIPETTRRQSEADASNLYANT